ncbi:hypothetical protein [Nostoc sp.]|uniref:hypothetical protein n=1 Tax=Nostoc sp. TaxID=1180 RepID=UPI002FF80F0D
MQILSSFYLCVLLYETLCKSVSLTGDARSSLTLRYRYRYAIPSSFILGNPSTGLAHRFVSTFKKPYIDTAAPVVGLGG